MTFTIPNEALWFASGFIAAWLVLIALVIAAKWAREAQG